MQHATHFLISILFFILLSLSAFTAAAAAATSSIRNRQSRNNTIVDFSSAPDCINSACLPSSNSPFSWTPQNLQCESTNTNGGDGGGGVSHDCFCYTARRPLLCQPYNTGNPTDCFLAVRKWYTTICNSQAAPAAPSQQAISVTQLPNCARTCVQNTLSHLGCPDGSLNCACQSRFLANNAARCVQINCNGDIVQYIGGLYTFASKWISQQCGYTPESQAVIFSSSGAGAGVGVSAVDDLTSGSFIAEGFEETSPEAGSGDWKEYANSPSASPQEILASDFHGDDYTNWQSALDAKRERNSNLGAIIPLSLVFGGIFGTMILNWLLTMCGCTRNRNNKLHEAWSKFWREVFGGIVWVIKWSWDGTKPVRELLGKIFKKIITW